MIEAINGFFILTTMVVGLGVVNPAYGDTNPPIEKDHRLHAVAYEEHVRQLNGTIEIHEQMKKDYERVLEEGGDMPVNKVKKMIRHCDALIDDAKEMKKDIAEFIEWHKKQLEESR